MTYRELANIISSLPEEQKDLDVTCNYCGEFYALNDASNYPWDRIDQYCADFRLDQDHFFLYTIKKDNYNP